jgi:hypothetical protein
MLVPQFVYGSWFFPQREVLFRGGEAPGME